MGDLRRNAKMTMIRARSGPDVIAELMMNIRRLPVGDHSSVLVGIDGGTGAGKTTLGKQIARELHGQHVSGDDFIRPRSQLRDSGDASPELGHVHDWRRCATELLRPLSRGVAADYQPFDWVSEKFREQRRIEPGLVVVEGVFTLRAELAVYFNYRIWLLADRHERIERTVARDGEWSRSSLMEWWMPDEDEYLREAAAHLREADAVLWE